MKNQYKICSKCGNNTLLHVVDNITICGYCMVWTEYFESTKTIKDRLNKNKSLLVEETRAKLTKTLNRDLIEELEQLIEADKKLLDERI